MISRWSSLQLACLLLCLNPLPSRGESETLSQWRHRIVSQLQLNTYFPIEGCGQDGQAKVAFKIDRTGKVLSSKVVGSTGFPVLDKAALKTVQNAQPFPPPPPEATGDDLNLIAPMNFPKPDVPISCEAVRKAEKLRFQMYNICRGC